MKALFVTLPVMLICACALAQQVDYIAYHTNINRAEEAFFLEGDCTTSLQYYRVAFRDFTYIFARDAINAAQIARYCGEDPLPFFLRGVSGGLRIQHLKDLPVLEGLHALVVADAAIMRDYEARRKAYLDSIDYTFLLRMYDRVMEDQIRKNDSDQAYSQFQIKLRAEVMAEAQKRGFPGARRLGIDHNGIFEEAMGKGQFDFDQRKQRKHGGRLKHLKLQDNSLSSKPAMLILIHDHCIFGEWESFLREAMRKGEIHPREVALIHDNLYIRRNECLEGRPDDLKYFKINMFVRYSLLPERTDAEINQLRAKWHIAALEVDEAKKAYEEKLDFRLSWGFWDCL